MSINGLLSSKQFEFRPQKSTEDAIKYVTDLAKKQMENKDFLMIVSLDNASWPQILVQLKRKYCAKNLFYLLKSYLNDRKAILQIGHIIAHILLSNPALRVRLSGRDFGTYFTTNCLKFKLKMIAISLASVTTL
jgi:hypothetical protein